MSITHGYFALTAVPKRVLVAAARLRPDPQRIVVGVAAGDGRVVDGHSAEATPRQRLETVKGGVDLNKGDGQSRGVRH